MDARFGFQGFSWGEILSKEIINGQSVSVPDSKGRRPFFQNQLRQLPEGLSCLRRVASKILTDTEPRHVPAVSLTSHPKKAIGIFEYKDIKFTGINKALD
jgi:hypothetical protein